MGVNKDGTGLASVITEPIIYKFGVSPDEEWVVVFSAGVGQNAEAATIAVPVHGGAAGRLCSRGCPTMWSVDGQFCMSEGAPPQLHCQSRLRSLFQPASRCRISPHREFLQFQTPPRCRAAFS
jgi:hypothetical protein